MRAIPVSMARGEGGDRSHRSEMEKMARIRRAGDGLRSSSWSPERENTRGGEVNGQGEVRTPRAHHLTPLRVLEAVVPLE
jgi:hypothetical protein